MPKYAQVMDDVKGGSKFTKQIEDLLSLTQSTVPSGEYFPTHSSELESSNIEKELMELKNREAEITGNYFSEEDFKKLKQTLNNEFFSENEFKTLQNIFKEDGLPTDVEDVDSLDGDVTVASTADSEAGEGAVLSVDNPVDSEEAQLEAELDNFLTISGGDDTEIGIGMEDDNTLSLDIGDVDLDINTDMVNAEDSVDEPMGDSSVLPEEDMNDSVPADVEMAEATLKKIINNAKIVVEQVKKYKENKMKPKIRTLTIKKKLSEAQKLKEKLHSLLEDDSEKVAEADLPIDVTKVPEEVLNANGSEQLVDTGETYTLEQEQKILSKIKSNIQKVLEQVVTYKKKYKKHFNKEVIKVESVLSKVFTETNTLNESVLFESLDLMTKKFDKLLEATFREEDDDNVKDKETDETDPGDVDELNQSVPDMDSALDKTEDVLTMESDVENAPSVLQVTLPDGVSANDVVVKVVEESDGAPVITIELPQGVDTEDISVTASEPEILDLNGNASEETPVGEEPVVTEEPVDTVPSEFKSETDNSEENVIEMPEDEDEEEETEEDEKKYEEATKLLNKKLLPIAENAKFVGYKANKNIMESAQKPDTSYNINLLKQTHLYYINEGKLSTDYRYPIADVIDGTVYAVPDALNKMVEMFNNPIMVKKIGKNVVKVVRARLTAYLEAMGKKAPWGTNKKSNIVITEAGMLLTVCHKRESHNPSKILKKIREDMQK